MKPAHRDYDGRWCTDGRPLLVLALSARWGREELALRLGITQSHLAALVGGLRRPSLDVANALERVDPSIPASSWSIVTNVARSNGATRSSEIGGRT